MVDTPVRLRFDPKQLLTERDELAVLDEDARHDPGKIGPDLVYHFHRFEDAQRLARHDPVAHLDVRLGFGVRRAVEHAHDRRRDLAEVGAAGAAAASASVAAAGTAAGAPGAAGMA